MEVGELACCADAVRSCTVPSGVRMGPSAPLSIGDVCCLKPALLIPCAVQFLGSTLAGADGLSPQARCLCHTDPAVAESGHSDTRLGGVDMLLTNLPEQATEAVSWSCMAHLLVFSATPDRPLPVQQQSVLMPACDLTHVRQPCQALRCVYGATAGVAQLAVAAGTPDQHLTCGPYRGRVRSACCKLCCSSI